MRFWDSSAIIPLLVSEEETKRCRALLEQDPEMLVWTFTLTEVFSALYRKVREGILAETHLPKIMERLKHLEECWSEIIQIETTRRKAHRLLAVHPLRAADALQLAAALLAFEDHPEGESLVTFDKNLALAARREGFQVLPS